MEINELVKISLLAGILNLETIQAGQFLISRPSFAGFLLGLVCGQPLLCFFAGILTEAIYLDFTPIGGAVPPNGVFAAAVFAALIPFCASFPVCFFLSISSGFIYAAVDRFLRGKKNSWNDLFVKEIQAEKFKPSKWVAKSLLLDFLAVFVFSFLAGLLLREPSRIFLRHPFLNMWADTAFIAIPFVALSSLYFRLSNQVRKND